jgi:hypothetical protein
MRAHDFHGMTAIFYQFDDPSSYENDLSALSPASWQKMKSGVSDPDEHAMRDMLLTFACLTV